MNECRKCNESIPDDGKFCPGCGAELKKPRFFFTDIEKCSYSHTGYRVVNEEVIMSLIIPWIFLFASLTVTLIFVFVIPDQYSLAVSVSITIGILICTLLLHFIVGKFCGGYYINRNKSVCEKTHVIIAIIIVGCGIILVCVMIYELIMGTFHSSELIKQCAGVCFIFVIEYFIALLLSKTVLWRY